MPSAKKIDAAAFSADTRDFLRVLHEKRVRYLIVGGEAVIFHGYARVTGDIDFFYARTEENVQRLYDALLTFWSGSVPGLQSYAELMEPGVIVQFGVPPYRIDLINRISGVTFEEAWPNRRQVDVRGEGFRVPTWFLGLDDLLRNKRASGRPKDLADVAFFATGATLRPGGRGRGRGMAAKRRKMRKRETA